MFQFDVPNQNSAQWFCSLNLKESLQEQKLHPNEKHEPYFEVSAIQASSVTLAWSGDENQR